RPLRSAFPQAVPHPLPGATRGAPAATETDGTRRGVSRDGGRGGTPVRSADARCVTTALPCPIEWHEKPPAEAPPPITDLRSLRGWRTLRAPRRGAERAEGEHMTLRFLTGLSTVVLALVPVSARAESLLETIVNVLVDGGNNYAWERVEIPGTVCGN